MLVIPLKCAWFDNQVLESPEFCPFLFALMFGYLTDRTGFIRRILGGINPSTQKVDVQRKGQGTDFTQDSVDCF